MKCEVNGCKATGVDFHVIHGITRNSRIWMCKRHRIWMCKRHLEDAKRGNVISIKVKKEVSK